MTDIEGADQHLYLANNIKLSLVDQEEKGQTADKNQCEGGDGDILLDFDPNFMPINPDYIKTCNLDAEDLYNRQEAFVIKVFGIFLIQLFIMTSYIFTIIMLKPKDYESMKPENDEVRAWAANFIFLIAAVVLGAVSLFLVVAYMKTLRDYYALNLTFGFLYTFSLTYIVGYATYDLSPNTVLAGFIGTLTMTIMMILLGKKIISALNRERQIRNALSPFSLVLGSVVVVLCIFISVSPFQKDGTKGVIKNGVLMFLLFTLVLFYMIIDLYAITNGKYCKVVSDQDYVYGSTKLFADFILCFTLIANFFGEADAGAAA